jgi:hypothetical protein
MSEPEIDYTVNSSNLLSVLMSNNNEEMRNEIESILKDYMQRRSGNEVLCIGQKFLDEIMEQIDRIPPVTPPEKAAMVTTIIEIALQYGIEPIRSIDLNLMLVD